MIVLISEKYNFQVFALQLIRRQVPHLVWVGASEWEGGSTPLLAKAGASERVRILERN